MVVKKEKIQEGLKDLKNTLKDQLELIKHSNHPHAQTLKDDEYFLPLDATSTIVGLLSTYLHELYGRQYVKDVEGMKKITLSIAELSILGYIALSQDNQIIHLQNPTKQNESS